MKYNYIKYFYTLVFTVFVSCGTNTNNISENAVNETDSLEIEEMNAPSLINEKSTVKYFTYGFHTFPDTVAKLNENQFVIIDSLIDKGLHILISNSNIKPFEIEYFYKECYSIEELSGVELENVRYAFVYYTNFDECPSSTYQSLYIVTNSEIIQLASIHKEADEERDENEPYIAEEKLIYLPFSLNNSFVLKQVGFFENISSEIEYAKSIISDMGNLNEFLKSTYIIEHLRIKDGSDTISRKTNIYNWNGNKSTLKTNK